MPDDLWSQWPPPPGSPPPPPPGGAEPEPQRTPPTWSSVVHPAPAAPGGWAQAPLRPPVVPVHRPGAFPLRPLGLGDMFDAAFRIIRYNAGATVGAAVLVAALAMALPVLVTALLTFGGWADLSSYGSDNVSEDVSSLGFASDDGLAVSVALVTVGLGSLLQTVGLLFVTAMGTRVTAAAAVGRRLRMADAWAETRGTRWRILGLSLLLAVLAGVLAAAFVLPLVLLIVVADSLAAAVLFGLVGGVALVCAFAWGWVRIAYLATPALVLERQGVRSAIARSRALTRHSFWRVFGIGLLAALAAGVASRVVAIPVSLLTAFLPDAVGDQYALLASVVGQAAGAVLSAAFVTPFLAVMAALQYHDQRIRKEAFDVVLMELAGLTGDVAR